jgi:polyketide synthase PksN
LEERLAIIVSSVAEAVDALNRFRAGDRAMAGLYRGNARKDKTGLPESDAASVADLLHKRALAELARLWVSGHEVDWRPLYGEDQPARLSLPTYPFARERYWLPGGERQAQAVAQQPPSFDEASYTRFIEAVLNGDLDLAGQPEFNG